MEYLPNILNSYAKCIGTLQIYLQILAQKQVFQNFRKTFFKVPYWGRKHQNNQYIRITSQHFTCLTSYFCLQAYILHHQLGNGNTRKNRNTLRFVQFYHDVLGEGGGEAVKRDQDSKAETGRYQTSIRQKHHIKTPLDLRKLTSRKKEEAANGAS